MARLSAFAIITGQDGRVLLSLRRDRDLWNLPGGGVDDSEAPWDATVREVLEETGLRINIQRLAGIYHKPGPNEISFAFQCTVAGGELTLTEEACEHRWFALDELPGNISQRQAERIRDALKSGQCVLREQEQPFAQDTLTETTPYLSIIRRAA